MFESSEAGFSTITSATDSYRTDGAGGFVESPRNSDPFSSSAPAFQGPIYPESDWDELMALQEENQSSPYHTHLNNVDIMSQQRTNYCWMFGVVAGAANRYAATGIEVPKFSPASTACQIKNFQNVGGWGSEAAAGVQKYGIATTNTWPNCSFDRTLPNNPRVRNDSFRHNIVEFNALGRYNINAVASCLLDPINPSPCSGGYSHWGHLVLLLKVVRISGQIGFLYANSWGKNWGDNGYGILLGSKAIPTEAIRIGSIKPIGE